MKRYVVGIVFTIGLLGMTRDAACDAPHLRAPVCPIPPAAAPGPADVVVTPALGSWSAVRVLVTAETHQILMTPGDYRSWGHLDLGPTWPSGTREQPIVLRYFDPNSDLTHPVDRLDPATEAVIHGVLWWGDLHDWVVRGLTIRAPDPVVANGMFHILNADRVVVDGNLVESSAASYGVRVRDSSGVCVQRNVIRNATNPANDNVAINVKPNTTDIVGLRILDNELVDWIDGVQLTNQGTLRVGALIQRNQIATTPSRHVQDPATGLVYGCTENAVDIKTPPLGAVYVFRNEMSGWLETPPVGLEYLCGTGFASGSAGDAVVVHIDATDVFVVGNDIRDSVSAVRASNRVGGRRLTIQRNAITNVPPPTASVRFYGGAAMVLEDDAIVNANRFEDVPLLCPRDGFPYPTWPPAGWNPAPPRILRNVTSSMIDGGSCNAEKVVEETFTP